MPAANQTPGTAESRVRGDDMPADVMQGADPAFLRCKSVRVTAWDCPCGYRTFRPEDRIGHAVFGHPATHNPDLTCQATAPWDHERWCIRAKDHDGDHWTPSAEGGTEWVNK